MDDENDQMNNSSTSSHSFVDTHTNSLLSLDNLADFDSGSEPNEAATCVKWSAKNTSKVLSSSFKQLSLWDIHNEGKEEVMVSELYFIAIFNFSQTSFIISIEYWIIFL